MSVGQLANCVSHKCAERKAQGILSALLKQLSFTPETVLSVPPQSHTHFLILVEDYIDPYPSLCVHKLIVELIQRYLDLFS